MRVAKANSSPIKLHIGCGTVYLDGWTNIDNNSDNNIAKLDMNVDLRNGLPFEDDSVDFIFNEHFFEHLTWDEGLTAIKEFMRVLRPGGVMRIAMPNLEDTIEFYGDDNWKANNIDFFYKYGMAYIQTRGQYVNMCFHAWGHKHLYDYEELVRLIKEAGFTNYHRQLLHESTYKELRNLETRNESTLVVEIEKELPPLVTVLCITYNHEKFIREALDSILMQKTNFRFEVLIADDASTDSTPQILKEYEDKHGDIIKVVYRKNNLGVYYNSLYALRMLRSKYVSLNEGDDYFYDPLKLQKQVDFMEKHTEFSMCFHPVKVIFESNKSDEIYPTPEVRFFKNRLLLSDLLKTNFIQTNSVMYRWRFVDSDISSFLPDVLPLDHYLHLLHAQNGDIGFINEVMSVYRKHSGGIWAESADVLTMHSMYGLELVGFFYEIYKNIAIDKEKYYTNTLKFALNSIMDSLQRSGNTDTIISIYEKYPRLISKLIWNKSESFNGSAIPVSKPRIRYRFIAFARKHCPRFLKRPARAIVNMLKK